MGRLFSGRVDLVISWAGDPNSQVCIDKSSSKSDYYKRTSHTNSLSANETVDARVANRTQSYDELCYLFFSLRHFKSRLNRIHVICPGGIAPNWWLKWKDWHKKSPCLTAETPKQKVCWVDETLLLPKNAPPCFNSQAFEVSLDKIPDLSEHFIYANDDMFFGNTISIKDFFTANGKPRLGFQRYWGLTPRLPHDTKSDGYTSSWRNNNEALDQRFGKQDRPHPEHQMLALTKSMICDAKNDAYLSSWFERTLHNSRRTLNDVNPTGLFSYYGLHCGHSELRPAMGEVGHFSDRINHNRMTYRRLIKHRPKLMCINDDTQDPSEQVQKELGQFLSAYFSEVMPSI